MPFFIRTRRLSIKRLENKPQESLSVVHTILSSSVKEVLANLKRVERAYYGVGRNAQDELKKWISSVKGVMQVAQISNLVSASKIEEIIKEAAHPQSKFTVDLYDMNKLKESYRKIRDNIPDKFSDILIDLRSILKYLEKYCLSFYDPECEIPLETAQHYEKNRQENEAIIRENFEVITMLPHKFKSSDLWLSDFSSFGIETARKGESTCAPFLVLFPECCERIRIICSTMMSWIKGDSNYALFISNDVKDLEKKKEAILKIVRDLQQNYHQLLFRLKQVQSECYKLQRELEKLQAKEDELLTDEEVLISETNDMQLDIERKEYRRDELIHNAAHMHPQILYERYSELSEELRDLKMRLPFVKRQMFNVQYKLGWIGDKKEELRLEKKKLLELNKEIYSVDHQKQAREEELKNTVQMLELSHQIYLCKSSPDAVEKIFYDQPVETNTARLPGQKGKEDAFERGCQIVAKNIDTDWPKLYRHLPFHPPRGITTIDRDVYELTNLAARTTPEEVCMRSLYKWRRFHTRAKLDDIQEALTDIRRFDTLQILRDELFPTREEVLVEENPYPFLEPYLVPFIKEVEKFDELRAANKI